MVLTVFAIYLLVVFSIAVFAKSFISKDEAGFYLGNRNFGPFVTAISFGATDSSAWVFIGAVGAAYTLGVSIMWILVGAVTGYIINWFIVAPRLNKYSEETNSLNLVDFFSKKVNDKKNLVKITASIIIVIFFVPYMAAQLTAVGTITEVVFDFDFNYGLILCAIFVLGYVMFGGYSSVMLTDFVQGLVMLAVLIGLPGYLIFQLGGFSNFFHTVMTIDPALVSVAGGSVGNAALSFIMGNVLFGLGSIGQPHITQRFISARDLKTIRQGSLIATFWIIINITSASLIGLLARIHLPNLDNPEGAFPALTNEFLPAILVGVTIAALFAATQSTLSAQLMVATQSIASDILKAVSRREYSDHQLLVISRWTMIILMLITAFIAALQIESVFKLVLYAWAGVASGFGPLLLFNLYTDIITKWGAFCGIVTGALVTIIWLNTPYAEYVYELVPAAIMATIVMVVVSKLTPDRTEEV